MSKKKKITLTLAAIIVAIGGGAQIYTNQQVEQVLQKFPYSLDNQLSLNVTENGKNFFSRDLTFSLENSDGEKTDVISTKLTALPFFITAESKLSDQLVRQLNKNLNITIDKNTINSKFSPVGDYLQSDVLTEFRDFTNKPQNLSVTLNFNAESKNVNIKTNLSGFNYDKNSKLEQLNGQLKFIPVGDNQYDISSLELNAKNAELDLMNGENTKIQLKNARYQFDVKKADDADLRDLTTQFSSDSLRIANKERTTEDSQTAINGITFNVQQKGVKSAVDFVDEFKKQLNGEQGIKNATHFFVAVLTQNQTFNGALSVKSVDAPKNQKPYFHLNDATLNLTLANADPAHADLALQLEVANVKQTPEEQNKQWEAQGAKMAYKLDGYALENALAFIPFYLDALTIKTPPKENNKAFLTLKDQWAKTFGGNSSSDITLKSFHYGNIVAEDWVMKNQTTERNKQYQGNSTLSLKKLALPDAQVQIEEMAFALPVTINDYPKLAEAQFCSGPAALLCFAYLTPETTQKLIENQWNALDISTDSATIALNLNTYPATKAYPLSINLKGGISPAKNKQTIVDVFTENMQGMVNLTLNKSLIETSEQDSQQIKNASPFWQSFIMEVKPNGELSPIFESEGDNYRLTLEKGKNTFLINGKTLDEIHQANEAPMDLPVQKN